MEFIIYLIPSALLLCVMGIITVVLRAKTKKSDTIEDELYGLQTESKDSTSTGKKDL